MSAADRLWSIAAAGWKRLRGPAQWRLLWLRHATFMIGVTGAVLDDRNRVLLLRHRFWKDCPWGTPSGYLERGESVQAGFAREVYEETGLRVDDVRVSSVHSGFRLRLEISVTGRLTGNRAPTVDGTEVVEARFFAVDELPVGIRASQRAVIEAALAGTDDR